MTLPAPVINGARTLVARRLGLDFPARRGADLERALTAAAGDAGELALLAALHEQPTSGPQWRALIAALTVRESYFFRDAPLFAALEQVLAELIARRRAAGDLRLALWSAGCAAGEEPYSLAMLVERLLGDPAGWQLTILATDVNAASLEAAAHGTYSAWALRETPAWARARHFRPSGSKRYELSRRIRELVTFAPLNLAVDGYPSSLDVIVCRNVLMYFTEAARRAAVARLASAVAPGGWLALSPLDSVAEPAGFEAVEQPGCRLLRRDRPVPAPTRPAAAPAPPALTRARAHADSGRLDAALVLCRAALREDALDIEAHLLLAAIEEERGDLDAAIAALRRAIYVAPDASTAHLRLGGLLLRTGALEEGRRSLATAAELLRRRPPETLVPGGLTAGSLLEALS